MPRFLERKLQAKYGKDSAIPYKIMNKLGFMRGNKETPKGAAAEKKHGIPGEKDKNTEVEKSKKDILNHDGDGNKHKHLTSDEIMGKSSSSQPVGNDRKVMSQTHKMDRGLIDGLIEDPFTSTEAVLRKGIQYDAQHEKEHKKSKLHAKKLLSDHMRGKLANQFIKGSKIKKDN